MTRNWRTVIIALALFAHAVNALAATPDPPPRTPFRPAFDDRLTIDEDRPGSGAEARYQAALDAYGREDLAAARAALRDALTRAYQPRYLVSLGYVEAASGDLEAAADAFEAAVASDPSQIAAYQELGYLNRALGRNGQAARWFRTALDAGGGENALAPETGYRLKSEIAAIENRFDVTLYSLFRFGRRNAAAISPTGRSLTQSQGGADFAAILPRIGFKDGRTIQLTGRLMWGYEPGSLEFDRQSFQAGLGLRVKPLKRQNLVLSTERLVSLGRAARDDWMARAAYSIEKGNGFDPFERSWTTFSFYGDAALIFPAGPDALLAAEARFGRSYRLGGRWAATPHLVLAGSYQEDGAAATTLLEGGPGVSLKMYFNDSAYHAFRASAEILLQYRAKLAGDSLGPSGLSAAMLMNF